MPSVLELLRQSASPARAGFADNKPGGLTSTTFPVQVQRVRQDIGKWREALSRAEAVFYPDRTALYNAYADTLLDAHLSSVISTRKINVLGKPFQVVDAAGKENPKLTKLLRRPWFRQACEYALDSKFWGHSLLEFDTPVDGQFHKVSLIDRQYVFPEAGLVRTMPGMITGIDYRNAPQFAPWVLEVGGRRDLGLLLKATPYVVWKLLVMGAWANFVELFGMPYRALVGDFDEKLMREYNQMMAEMGEAAYGIFPTGSDFKFVNAPNSTGQVYDTYIERANSELSKLILGQTMTTDNGSSRSQGEVHERVAGAYERDDAAWLTDWVNEELLPFLLRHGYPLAGYEFRFDESESLGKEAQFKIVQGIMQHGTYNVSKQYLEETFGVKLEEKPAPAVAPPALPGKPQGRPAPVQPAPPTASLTSRIDALYAHACPRCEGQAAEVRAAAGDEAKLTKLVNRLIEALYGGDLFANTIDQPLYHYLRAHFEEAVQLGFGVVDEKLRGYLLANVQRFSGFKTAAVQRAMTEKLTDAAGNIRPFADFKTDCLAINQQYNVDYLRTEYNQAVASSQMAAKWSEFDPESRLRYDTVGDDLVRKEHQALDGITRPHSDPFWDSHYPPLDWNCRCTVTEVDHDTPTTPLHGLGGLPEAAKEFRQNVGKTGDIFGMDHPYFQLSADEARQLEQQL